MKTHVFYGLTDEVVLVIAGIHGSELSSIEVAHWLRVKLERDAAIPLYTTILIPELYPKQAELARQWRIAHRFTAKDNPEGRNIIQGGETIDPNRQFPTPGEPLSSFNNTGKTPGGLPVLPETRALLKLIEVAKPKRIASLHSHSAPDSPQPGTDAPGIFVDPRYKFDVQRLTTFPGQTFLGKFNANQLKFNESIDPAFPKKPGKKVFPSSLSDEGKDDDKLALSLAKDIYSVRPDLVPGNHVNKATPVVHYAASTPPTNPGFSLGDWAPVKIDKPNDPGGRDWGIPDITVEVRLQYESWAFINGEQFYDEKGKPIPSKTRPLVPGTQKTPYPFDRERAAALRVYADAILREFLGVKL